MFTSQILGFPDIFGYREKSLHKMINEICSIKNFKNFNGQRSCILFKAYFSDHSWWCYPSISSSSSRFMISDNSSTSQMQYISKTTRRSHSSKTMPEWNHKPIGWGHYFFHCYYDYSTWRRNWSRWKWIYVFFHSRTMHFLCGKK